MDFSLGAVLAREQFGLLGLLGGLASYFYPPSTEPRFSIWMFVSKLVAAFFGGKVFGEFIATENNFKSGYIMALDFFAYRSYKSRSLDVVYQINDSVGTKIEASR